MHLRLLSILVSLGVTCAAGAAVVYKWTDADGVIHYSDQAVPGAEKMVTSSGSSNGIGGPTRPGASSAAPPRVNAGVLSGLGYERMAILSPTADQVFFADEPVTVRLDLQPILKASQSITWQLNGKTLDDQQNSTAFSLASLPRGAYTIVATVSDPSTGASQSTPAVNFNVRQPSELAPLNRGRH